MNIAIIGHGKMGQLIEKLSLEREHNVSVVFNDSNWSPEDLTGVDVAIEFSNPQNVVDNIYKCLKAGVNVVVGTTGWYEEFKKVENWVKEFNCGFIAATNFSIGVNIFYEINKKLASLMNKNSNYRPAIMETHHLQKIDSPSGTAITLAEQIIKEMSNLEKWEESQNMDKNILNISSKREKGVPGTHDVFYESEIDKISISHKAKNRQGFALGAVVAAEQIAGKKGVFTMSDIIKF